MNTKRQYRTYTKEFKEEALSLIIEQGYSVPQAADALGVSSNLLYTWKQKTEELESSNVTSDERIELLALRKEVKQLRVEKEIFKKGQCLLRERNEVKFRYIRDNRSQFEIKTVCKVLKVSRSAYYDWLARPAKIISENELKLYRTAKRLFKRSRNSLGSRQLAKKLREEGFVIGRYRTRSIMRKLGLVVTQRQAYKVTTKRKHSDSVADNVLSQNFNPLQPNQAWAGDVTYLRTNQGWLYLAIVMDLNSRRIIGWSLSKRMTVSLVERALQMAITLRRSGNGVLFHSDRGSQYTSKQFQSLLTKNGMIASMSSVGACLDNAVVERFFGSLKHEWLLNIVHLTRESMKQDVEEYIRYYNHERLHTTLGDLTPINYEKSQSQVSSCA
ncbi:IS3 family transposase [Photobacterium kishitanii]|uniref:IS3 family transposase n=1 Tax=Photobacterium kishitanii TaxID=318456 RepID=A0AAX0YWT7_9GAMM|nr:IS3 family transposase [Photobacterium kishitanii]PSX20489.1 IS3 family transposase [Photobacterium kishitanii]PSX29250.1 IS3 family transposase [Photobacterium kishitanii]PSX33642.1 IS3 family transposase [Photobacterium kishitanii]PSX46082.1 IS3 family transposase [Photobacterium kishitanii]